MASSKIQGPGEKIFFSPISGPRVKQYFKESPSTPFFPALKDSSHISLEVKSDLPATTSLPVTVIDGSTGAKVSLLLSSTDTGEQLRQMYSKLRPGPQKELHLSFNGKPVEAKQTMAELGVKAEGLFITFVKCTGG